jgi:hypothetical protein
MPAAPTRAPSTAMAQIDHGLPSEQSRAGLAVEGAVTGPTGGNPRMGAPFATMRGRASVVGEWLAVRGR